MNVKHIATIAAYPLKTGGFRGVILNRETKERTASDVLPTLDAAKFWAKSQAHNAFEAIGYSLAPLRRRGEYQANVWVQA
jgi:hypothetical protein